jgi:hypothetical protein
MSFAAYPNPDFATSDPVLRQRAWRTQGGRR